MLKETSKIKKVADELAISAGKILAEGYNKVRKITYKGRINIVTDIDEKSEKFLVQNIKKNFPAHRIIAEEGGEVKGTAEYCWYIDPLDGTSNYAHNFQFFCVSIGVEYEGKIIYGVVYAPLLNEFFWAEKNKGAYLNDKKISVSKISDINKAMLATGFPYDIKESKENNINYFTAFAKQSQAIRRVGSAALDLCYVACGRFEGFWEIKLSPWDMAAGKIIVEEAGGKVTGFDGKELNLFKEKILSSNKILYNKMLEIIKKCK